MEAKEIRFTGANGVSLPGIIWYPMCSPTMVVQITHGMTEHIGRYEELADMLTAYGIAVAGFDLRGHGHNPGDNQCASFGEGGWNYALHDMHLFYLELESKFPNIPHFMLGFSLGSFLLRDYLSLYRDKVDGAIIMGTGHQPGAVLSMLIPVVKREIKAHGFDSSTQKIKKLSFETYNQKFAPNMTSVDWLCSDTAQRIKYRGDPLCRKTISAGLFWQLLDSMKRTGKPASYRKWNKQMPVLLILKSSKHVLMNCLTASKQQRSASMIFMYFRLTLLTVKAVSTKYVKARNEYLTPHTIREIHKVLRNAFNQAVKWELMIRNPVEHATLPKEEHKTRDIWTAEVLLKALEACDDDILRLAINLAFSCSLRMGELLGLTWDCVDISPASIELGQASIFVEKELQRVNREAMADLNGKDILFKFPPTFASTHTALVLKTPKTKTSVRKVFLPKTVAEMLVQRKADIEELKDLFGDEFTDFNLVFCSSNGKPIEGQVINRAFNKLIEENGLPKVVFHSLRHSSITYKLKLNGGDMKSVQGDSGHAQVKMVADVYSHIIDDDRRLNAERLEAAFYSGRTATPEPVQKVQEVTQDDDTALLMRLLQNPEMSALLKTLAKNL